MYDRLLLICDNKRAPTAILQVLVVIRLHVSYSVCVVQFSVHLVSGSVYFICLLTFLNQIKTQIFP